MLLSSSPWRFLPRCIAQQKAKPLGIIASSITEASTTSMMPTFQQFVDTNPRVILGSGSRTRKAIMDELSAEYQFRYEIMSADIDEKAIRCDSPDELVKILAVAKAEAIKEKLSKSSGEQLPEVYLLTCDQVVVHDNKVMEKPQDETEARLFITSFAKSPPATVGSVLCTHLPSGTTSRAIDRAEAAIEPIPAGVIERLIEEGSVYYSAGGLMVEHPLVSPYVTKITGGMDTIMGLRKATVMRLLLETWSEIRQIQ